METFQLYKKRDFNALVSDTLQFFKLFWKNYLLNFVILVGGILLITVGLQYLSLKENIFTNAADWRYTGLFGGNLLLGFLILIGYILFGLVSTSFPLGYLRLVATQKTELFGTSELFAQMKGRIGRLLLFGLMGTFTLGILTLIFVVIGILLCFIIIGIPVLIVGGFTLMVWSIQAMYVYVEEETGFFEALTRGWHITFNKNYWSTVGSTAIMMMCIMFISSVLSIVPVMETLMRTITTGHAGAIEMSPAMMILTLLSSVVSYLLNNLLYVQQGLIYYSSLEDAGHFQAFTDIDTIGTNNEE